MLAGPLLGYFASGHFSMFGSFVAELFPTRIRATGQGTSYNIGRMAGAVAPYVDWRCGHDSRRRHRPGARRHVRILPARRRRSCSRCRIEAGRHWTSERSDRSSRSSRSNRSGRSNRSDRSNRSTVPVRSDWLPDAVTPPVSPPQRVSFCRRRAQVTLELRERLKTTDGQSVERGEFLV